MNNWRKTSEELPGGKYDRENGVPPQVDILMWSKEWGGWFKGLFNRLNEHEYSWAIYDQQNDCFYYFAETPEYWCAPNPEAEIRLQEEMLKGLDNPDNIINR